jgi:predicted phage-related endonuclease
MASTPTFFGGLVDELGLLKAQIAELTVREAEITRLLKATNESEIDGETFRATISRSERDTIDAKALRAAHPDIAAEFTRTTSVTTVRVGARVKAAA